jgi:hypothetical protein
LADPTKARIECGHGCGFAEYDPTVCLLVKVFGMPMRILFTCPVCKRDQRRDVPETKVAQLCLLFRAVGNPLVQLPPQGDLPWPKVEYDDILDFALSFDQEMEALLGGG